MQNFLLVAAGGAIGAIIRYSILLASVQLYGDSLPWGTFVANVLGCFVLGVLLGFGVHQNFETHYLLFGVGVLGAMTTFSTFSGETVMLALDGNWWTAFANVAATVFGCLMACFLGISLVRWLVGS